MKKIPMILLAMFTLSGCDRQEMIYSFNHVEEASVDNEVENTESVDNIQAETEQAVDITTEEPEISDVYSGPTVKMCIRDRLSHIPFRVCTGINQNGEGAESFPESNQDFRRVRQTDVLSEK